MTPRVRDIIYHYIHGNLKEVNDYLTQSQMTVDSSTWSGQVKQTIEKKEFLTAQTMIEFVAFKFLLNTIENEKNKNN